MDFDIPQATQELLARVRELVDGAVIPAEAELLAAGVSGDEPAMLALRERVRAAGLWGPQIPRELGGMGLPAMDHAMVSEELGRSPIGHFAFGCQAPDAGNLEILHRYGSDEHKRRWLEPLAAGRIRSCFAMTEPETSGSNPTDLRTSARRDGDHYVIDGHKWFTSSADGAAFAVVMAVTNPGAPTHGRASQIIVPTDTPGWTRVRNVPVMGHAGRGWGSHAEIRLEGVRVPVENRLGPEGAGFLIAQERLGPGRIHHCMRWVGICERSLELMVRRAASREIAPGKPLASRQIVQAWIAESRASIHAARLMVLDAAWKIDRHGFQSAREEISCIKFFVADVMMQVVDRAIQVHGALGVSSDTVLSYFYAHERGARIYDGPDEVHKMVVAKRVTERLAGRAR
ncbi:MAG TPA: acyl-CoA dehydrogenase family protein [Kofleriaceae bacterium]|nr:acyl-CoA dehydrogenase family protein [Kofleriaceae bacterium]